MFKSDYHGKHGISIKRKRLNDKAKIKNVKIQFTDVTKQIKHLQTKTLYLFFFY